VVTWRCGPPPESPGANPRVRLAAAAAIAAVSDLEATPDLYAPGGAVHDLMGTTPGAAPDDRYLLGNPLRRLPLGVPLILVHGTADATVPPRRSRDFAAAARDAGDEVTLVEPEGVGHRAIVDPRRREWDGVLSWLADALGARAAAGSPGSG
jgi:dipeptidyl aminopeptidase/acylaminoacyl peptidase